MTAMVDELVFFMEIRQRNKWKEAHSKVAHKCGSCGCEAHSLRCEWRSLSDLQSLALDGKYGKQVVIVRPFLTLNASRSKKNLDQEISITHTKQNVTYKENSLEYSGECSGCLRYFWIDQIYH